MVIVVHLLQSMDHSTGQGTVYDTWCLRKLHLSGTIFTREGSNFHFDVILGGGRYNLYILVYDSYGYLIWMVFYSLESTGSDRGQVGHECWRQGLYFKNVQLPSIPRIRQLDDNRLSRTAGSD